MGRLTKIFKEILVLALQPCRAVNCHVDICSGDDIKTDVCLFEEIT